MKFLQAESCEQIQIARELFHEYQAELNIDLCFQDFDREVAELPGKYAPPPGRLLLAIDEDEHVAGCIALRPCQKPEGQGGQLRPRSNFEPVADCEMKRLFIRPEFRGRGLGSRLVAAILNAAREIGYQRMLLDTIPGKMDSAIALYRRAGFREIEPYCHNPVEGALFMELLLE